MENPPGSVLRLYHHPSTRQPRTRRPMSSHCPVRAKPPRNLSAAASPQSGDSRHIVESRVFSSITNLLRLDAASPTPRSLRNPHSAPALAPSQSVTVLRTPDKRVSTMLSPDASIGSSDRVDPQGVLHQFAESRITCRGARRLSHPQFGEASSREATSCLRMTSIEIATRSRILRPMVKALHCLGLLLLHQNPGGWCWRTESPKPTSRM